jgi:hypothetical protein
MLLCGHTKACEDRQKQSRAAERKAKARSDYCTQVVVAVVYVCNSSSSSSSSSSNYISNKVTRAVEARSIAYLKSPHCHNRQLGHYLPYFFLLDTVEFRIVR